MLDSMLCLKIIGFLMCPSIVSLHWEFDCIYVSDMQGYVVLCSEVHALRVIRGQSFFGHLHLSCSSTPLLHCCLLCEQRLSSVVNVYLP
uniref:Secreted protein n=1 Tax=Parascaris univalens TaxID=6257 RepID=A0A914ZPF4_PARUN